LSIAVVTDSTSDLDPKRAAELGITLVPLFVVFGDTSYRDNIDLTRREFFAKLREGTVLPTTSQPTPQMFEDAFRPLIEAGHDILCVTISSYLSGTMNAARTAAQQFPDAKIVIYDSLSAAGGLGLLALRARELVAEGADWDTLLAKLDRERATERLYACIPDLSHIQRTGRIGKVQQVLGTLMKIVPVIVLKDGQVSSEAQVRTFARAQSTMVDLAVANIEDYSKARFLVLHTDAPHLAEGVMAQLVAKLGDAKPLELSIAEAGPVIAAHAGPGATGLIVALES
jgi:DegV family protein with EDD domain